MSDQPVDLQLSPKVLSVLANLRRQIRWYVWAEGIALAVVWLGLTFWIALAIDYLPVLFGLSELPWQARAVILVIISLVLGWILYQYVFRRAFVKLKNQSMALILERHFSELDDSLITSVESDEKTRFAKLREKEKVKEGDPEMLAHTRRQAEERVANLRVSNVFNFRPLLIAGIAGTLLLLTVGSFAWFNTEGFLLGSKRLYLLKEEPWPRRSLIELVGAKIHRENPLEGVNDIAQVVEFKNNEIRVAKGSSLTLLVRAAASDQNNPDRKVPDSCTVIYRTEDGQRGSQAMKKIGTPRDGYQKYNLDTEPFKGVLSELRFELRGGDHRIGPFFVKVVDTPTVVQTRLKCEFPSYMVDQESGRWTKREIDWSSGLQLPVGTNLKIRCRANKPLSQIYAYDKTTDKMNVLTPTGDPEWFELSVPSIADALTYEFVLKDTDGVVAEDPHRISIGAIEDEAPQINTRLSGIGSAVTPDVRIPLTGEIKDDYGTQRTWIEIETPVTKPLEEEFKISGKGAVDTAIDFREKRQADRTMTLPTGPESKITVVVKAADRFNLNEQQPNVGVGDQYVLDVVDPKELLNILDRSEVNQRKRLEQIFDELNDCRNLIAKTSGKSASLGVGAEPGDEPGDKDKDKNAPRKRELRLLFAQRATLQVQKSIQELTGVSDAFEDIRLQLVNNRVDSEDRKLRLEKKIVKPLRQIAGKIKPEQGRAQLTQIDKKLIQLESLLEQIQIQPTETLEKQAELLTNNSLEQLDDTLIQLNSLISILLKFENQSELIAIVQRFLNEQKELHERTKKEREKRAFEGLLDDD